MQKANSEKVALLNQLDAKEALLKWGASVDLSVFVGIACAFIFGKNK